MTHNRAINRVAPWSSGQGTKLTIKNSNFRQHILDKGHDFKPNMTRPTSRLQRLMIGRKSNMIQQYSKIRIGELTKTTDLGEYNP